MGLANLLLILHKALHDHFGKWGEYPARIELGIEDAFGVWCQRESPLDDWFGVPVVSKIGSGITFRLSEASKRELLAGFEVMLPGGQRVLYPQRMRLGFVVGGDLPSLSTVNAVPLDLRCLR